MSRLLRSRRMAYIGAVLIIGLSACGSPADVSSPAGTSAAGPPPVIQIDGSTSARGSAAAPMADASTSESTKMMAGPITYFYGGEVIDLTAPAASWYFDPNTAPTTDQIAALAAALGVDGDVRPLSADMGGGWMVGPDNYEQPTINVASDAMQSWWYNPGSSAVMTSAPCEIYPPGEPARDADDSVSSSGSGSSSSSGGVSTEVAVAPDAAGVPADGTSPGTPTPVCAEPTPPANVPDKAAAESKARELFQSLGVDPDSYQYETYADEWGANVTAYLVLDGIRTSMSLGVGYGAEGALTWASGFLATPQRGADYPRVGIEAAVQRLNDQSAGWMAYDTPMRLDTQTDVAVATEDVAPAVAPASAPASAPTGTQLIDPVEGVCLDDSGTECAPIPPINVDPITVTLTNARPSLEQLWASDGTVWLLPGYAFDSAEGDINGGGIYSVMAVEDKYIEVTEPTEVPVPDVAPPVVDPGVDPGAPTADCPPVPTERTDPGLSVDIAGEIVGLCLADAEAVVSEQFPEATVRVVRIDGVDQAVTDDFSESRVNVAVDRGLVSEVVSIG